MLVFFDFGINYDQQDQDCTNINVNYLKILINRIKMFTSRPLCEELEL